QGASRVGAERFSPFCIFAHLRTGLVLGYHWGMHTTPVSLLERVRRLGEQQAWERFVDMYTPLLYHWACRMGMQQSDAADLVQEVFTVLVAKLPEFVYDRQKSFRG